MLQHVIVQDVINPVTWQTIAIPTDQAQWQIQHPHGKENSSDPTGTQTA
jgi:hypothetical protein